MKSLYVELSCVYCKSKWQALVVNARAAENLETTFKDLHATCQEVDHYE